jgi:hypothetical protein
MGKILIASVLPNKVARIAVPFAVVCTIACGERETSGDTASGATATALSVRIDVARACDAVAGHLRSASATRVEVKADSFPEFTGSARRSGCVVRADGTLGGPVTVPFLTSALADSLGPGWTRDTTMVADGPRGTAYVLTRGDVSCLFRVNWTMRVRYDTKADPPPYTANIGCAATPARGSAP